MLSFRSKALAAFAVICVAASPGLLSAGKPPWAGGGNGGGNGNGGGKPGNPGKPPKGDGTGADLTGVGITFKTRCAEGTSCTVNNLTLVVRNQGGDDAGNSRVEYYLSDDTTLTTTSEDELTTPTDDLIHRVALGTVKAGKTKKRTLGGGLLKQLNAASGQYVIALLDADNTTSESDELNNIVVSDPLP